MAERPVRLLAVLGPTASGKTRLAVELARRLNGEIISADSRQVFRGMDIGTGKDLHLYGTVPWHLIDIREAGEDYHVAAFQNDFLAAVQQITERSKLPVLCGGTGLYLQAALQELSFVQVPVNEDLRRELADKSTGHLQNLFRQELSNYHPGADTGTRKRLIRAIEIARYLQQNPQPDVLQTNRGRERRPAIDPLVIGIDLPRETRRERITERLQQRLEAGLIDEVRNLMEKGVSGEKLVFYGLEYKYVVMHLRGELSYRELTDRLNTAIHRFAKRQMTFFRKLEKDGLPVRWIDGTLPFREQLKQALELAGN